MALDAYLRALDSPGKILFPVRFNDIYILYPFDIEDIFGGEFDLTTNPPVKYFDKDDVQIDLKSMKVDDIPKLKTEVVWWKDITDRTKVCKKTYHIALKASDFMR